MYESCKYCIQNGNIVYDKMKKNLGLFLLTEQINDQQYMELINLLDAKYKPVAPVETPQETHTEPTNSVQA